jgi:RimJ/RimL family protein N-acetyltransferase
MISKENSMSKQNSMAKNYSLRPLHASDADWIFEACQDLEIQKWTEIPKPYTRDHSDSFAKTLSGDVEVWVIERDSSGKPFGVIGVHSINPATRVALIGYWIAPWGRNQGAMKAGLKLYIAKVSTNPNIAYIRANIAEENLASRKSVESAGFVFIGDSGETCNCGGVDVKAVTYECAVGPVRSLLTL